VNAEEAAHSCATFVVCEFTRVELLRDFCVG
jgi:hypothetical protein